MADRTDSTGKLHFKNSGEFVYDPTVSGGEALNRHSMANVQTDGLVYKATASAGAQFAGLAQQAVALTDTEARLQNDVNVLVKAVVAATDAAAIQAQALRVKGSGGSDALVAADLGDDVYANDDLTLVLVAGATTGDAKVGHIALIDVANQVAYIKLEPFNGTNAP